MLDKNEGFWYPQRFTFKFGPPNDFGFIQFSPSIGLLGGGYVFRAPRTGDIDGFAFLAGLLQQNSVADRWAFSLYEVGANGLPAALLASANVPVTGLTSNVWQEIFFDTAPGAVTKNALYAVTVEAATFGALSTYRIRYPLGPAGTTWLFPYAISKDGGGWNKYLTGETMPALALHYDEGITERYYLPYGCLPLSSDTPNTKTIPTGRQAGFAFEVPWAITSDGVSVLMTNAAACTASLYQNGSATALRSATITAGQMFDAGDMQYCQFFWPEITLAPNVKYRVGFSGNGNTIGVLQTPGGSAMADTVGGAQFYYAEHLIGTIWDEDATLKVFGHIHVGEEGAPSPSECPPALAIVLLGDYEKGHVREIFGGAPDDDGVPINWQLFPRPVSSPSPQANGYYRRLVTKVSDVRAGQEVNVGVVFGPGTTNPPRVIQKILTVPADVPLGLLGFGGVQLGTEMDLTCDLGLIATNARAILYGQDLIRIRGLEWHVKSKPLRLVTVYNQQREGP